MKVQFITFIGKMRAGSLAAGGYSFPSGHTTAATAFAAALFIEGDKRYS